MDPSILGSLIIRMQIWYPEFRWNQLRLGSGFGFLALAQTGQCGLHRRDEDFPGPKEQHRTQEALFAGLRVLSESRTARQHAI